jgi:hypothetical protein
VEGVEQAQRRFVEVLSRVGQRHAPDQFGAEIGLERGNLFADAG